MTSTELKLHVPKELVDYSRRVRFADIEIECVYGGEGEESTRTTLYFYRVLLCKSSAVFDSAIGDTDTSIEIKGTPSAVNAVLNLVYDGELAYFLDEATAIEALPVMHKFDIDMSCMNGILRKGAPSKRLLDALEHVRFDFRSYARWRGRQDIELPQGAPAGLRKVIGTHGEGSLTDDILYVAPYAKLPEERSYIVNIAVQIGELCYGVHGLNTALILAKAARTTSTESLMRFLVANIAARDLYSQERGIPTAVPELGEIEKKLFGATPFSVYQQLKNIGRAVQPAHVQHAVNVLSKYNDESKLYDGIEYLQCGALHGIYTAGHLKYLSMLVSAADWSVGMRSLVLQLATGV